MSFPLGRLRLESAETKDDVRKLRYRARVVNEFRWESDVSQRGVTVPEGFETDGGSVPRFFWRLLGGPLGPARDAYIVHDLLYSQAGVHHRTRKECDDTFREVMRELGLSTFKTLLTYWGVRLGGWLAFNKYKKVNLASR